MPPLKDIAGQRFGRLTALVRVDSNNGGVTWRCLCDCEGMADVRGGDLRSGQQRSCGCLRRMGLARVKHGHARVGARHPLYRTWLNMRDRCRNSNSPGYTYYGGRGIKVCDRWDDFTAFLADMGEKPGPEYSIDRIDNEGNYEPGNCRWATPKEQTANRRSKTHCLRGHPFDEANTYWTPDGYRVCRVCRQDAQRHSRAAAKAQIEVAEIATPDEALLAERHGS